VFYLNEKYLNIYNKNLNMENKRNICNECKGPLLEDNTPDLRKVKL